MPGSCSYTIVSLKNNCIVPRRLSGLVATVCLGATIMSTGARFAWETLVQLLIESKLCIALLDIGPVTLLEVLGQNNVPVCTEGREAGLVELKTGQH
jgi:hypothetical protein